MHDKLQQRQTKRELTRGNRVKRRSCRKLQP
jgi:hypothetical protein